MEDMLNPKFMSTVTDANLNYIGRLLLMRIMEKLIFFLIKVQW